MRPWMIGMLRWWKAGMRTSVFWPGTRSSASFGDTRALIISSARVGTISISVWPGATTPPTVKMVMPTTLPVAGARTSGLGELLPRRHQLGRQVAELQLGLTQLVHDVFGLAAFEADGLHLGLADGLLRLGGLRAVGAVGAAQVGGGALQRADTGLGRVALGGELLHALQFVGDQGLLLGVGAELAVEALDLLVQFADPLAEHAALGRQRTAAGLHLGSLEAHGVVGDDLVVGRQGQRSRRGR